MSVETTNTTRGRKMTTQKRATKGGQVGVNGEFYEGGKFLPNTEKPKGKPAKRKARKVEIEPCKWVEIEEGQFPIFRMVGAQARWIDRYNTSLGIEPFPQGVAYYGDEYHGHKVADLCERYNRGERLV